MNLPDAERVADNVSVGVEAEDESAKPVLSVRLLGAFAVAIDGYEIGSAWRLRKAKTLVKLLALAPGHRLSRDTLTDTLWGDLESAAAGNNLHQALHAARRAMAVDGVDSSALLGFVDDAVVLGPGADVVVDAGEFESAATGRTTADRTALERAIALWGGDLLPEDADAEWVLGHRDRLGELYVDVTARLAAVLIDDGEPDRAVELLAPLVTARPVDEPLHRIHFTALAAAGRRWDALAGYEQLRSALEEEYAASPDPETRALYRRLLGTAAVSGGPNNLPTPSSTFVGRHRELSELTTLLHRSRLLTLTGPGGAGKTRLALELARRVLDAGEHKDGVWFVEYAGLHDSDLTASALATALGVSLPGEPTPSAVASQIADREALLVIDNCEHLLDASAGLVTEVLARCPGLAIVTTSREPLGVPGEVTWRVPSLALPSPEGSEGEAEMARLEAVQLFLERGREAAPGFALDSTTASPVASICYRLDGMPLALELAAARLAHMSVGQLADRLGDVLSVLAHRSRGRLDRQQTLTATLDWSYELLDSDERTLFRRLAVFVGGFELDAAIAVCGDELHDVEGTISRLVDKSLVHADTSRDPARYRLLEVVRQYAEQRLAAAGENARMRRSHREWFDSAAERHDPDRAGPVVREPTEWFDLESDNLRAALTSALSDDPPAALRLATSTWRFWLSRGQIAEGSRWIGLSLDASPDASATRARALFAAAVYNVRRGDASALGRVLREFADLRTRLDDPDAVIHGLHSEGVLTYLAGDWERCEAIAAEIRSTVLVPAAVLATSEHLACMLALNRSDLDAARERVDAAIEALALVPDTAAPFFTAMTLGWVVDERGRYPIPVGEETVLFGRRVGKAQAVGYSLVTRALIRRLGGDLPRSIADLEEAEERFRAVADDYGRAVALRQRGHALRWAGDLGRAADAFDTAADLTSGLRDERALAMSLAGQALVRADAGDGQTARVLARRAIDITDRSGDGAGTSLTVGDAAVIELRLGDIAAAEPLLRQACDHDRDVPGGQRALGWIYVLHATVLQELGRDVQAAATLDEARKTFEAVGDFRGLEAVDTAAKTMQRTRS